MSSGEKDFPGLGFDPTPGIVPAIDHLAETVRRAAGQLGNARGDMEGALRNPRAWTGLAGASCHDAVQHIYPDVWITHDAVAGVAGALEEWSTTLTAYQSSRTDLEARAVAARTAVKQAKDQLDESMSGAMVFFSGSDEEKKAFLARADAAQRVVNQTEDALDAILEEAKALKKQHQESAEAFAVRIRGFADRIPDRQTMAPGGSGILPPYYTKPSPNPEDVGPKRAFDVSEPTAKDRVTLMAAKTMVVGQDVRLGNDRAASFMKHWLEGDGRDVQIDAKEFLNDNPVFQQIVNQAIKDHGPKGSFDTGWESGAIHEDMDSIEGNVPKEVQDWYYSMNGYEYRIVGTDFTMVDGQPVGQVRIDIYKRYNWGNPEGGKHRDDIYGVSQNDLARLHETGLAQDFDITGSTTMYVMPSSAP